MSLEAALLCLALLCGAATGQGRPSKLLAFHGLSGVAQKTGENPLVLQYAVWASAGQVKTVSRLAGNLLWRSFVP